jgi:hypothetical protein
MNKKTPTVHTTRPPETKMYILRPLEALILSTSTLWISYVNLAGNALILKWYAEIAYGVLSL